MLTVWTISFDPAAEGVGVNEIAVRGKRIAGPSRSLLEVRTVGFHTEDSAILAWTREALTFPSNPANPSLAVFQADRIVHWHASSFGAPTHYVELAEPILVPPIEIRLMLRTFTAVPDAVAMDLIGTWRKVTQPAVNQALRHWATAS